MPTYTYKCSKCGHGFEKFQKITENPLKKCPECKGPVKRLIGTGAGVIFKGKGFYQTDYKDSGPKTSDNDKNKGKTPPCGKKDSCPGCEG
ncbi:MAG: zinc ribbon domain-containing protein [Candidatus Omnitrophica bacterium]|nr:zinc ribbon domain-containing protein [Candidatus Omnitrophota bacterium]